MVDRAARAHAWPSQASRGAQTGTCRLAANFFRLPTSLMIENRTSFSGALAIGVCQWQASETTSRRPSRYLIQPAAVTLPLQCLSRRSTVGSCWPRAVCSVLVLVACSQPVVVIRARLRRSLLRRPLLRRHRRLRRPLLRQRRSLSLRLLLRRLPRLSRRRPSRHRLRPSRHRLRHRYHLHRAPRSPTLSSTRCRGLHPTSILMVRTRTTRTSSMRTS